MPEDLRTKLQSLQADNASTPAAMAMEDLESIRAAIQDTLLANTAAVSSLQPGFRTQDGQQIRFNIRVGEANHVLFRAFVPPTGYPVKLDFYNEELSVAPDKVSLEQLVFEFLREEDTRTTITSLTRYAR